MALAVNSQRRASFLSDEHQNLLRAWEGSPVTIKWERAFPVSCSLHWGTP